MSRGHGAARARRLPWWGQALTATSEVRLCGASAAAAPHRYPRYAVRVRCVPSAPGPPLAGWQALQLLFALGLSGRQALIGP